MGEMGERIVKIGPHLSNIKGHTFLRHAVVVQMTHTSSIASLRHSRAWDSTDSLQSLVSWHSTTASRFSQAHRFLCLSDCLSKL